MKKILIFIFVLLFAFLTGCQKEPQTPPCETQTPLSEFQFKHEYSISKLRSFFGELSIEEMEYYSDNSKFIYMKDVNKKFPIEYLRVSLNKYQNYAVYKVKEGGYYYVFWQRYIEYDDDMHVIYDGGISFEKSSVAETHYLTPNCFCSVSDFDSLVIGESTAEDVAKIDPEFEMKFLFSSGERSFSYLNDGSIYTVYYDMLNRGKSRSDYVVSRKVHRTVEDLKGHVPTYIATIHPEDLP